jgi:hypothetical protein
MKYDTGTRGLGRPSRVGKTEPKETPASQAQPRQLGSRRRPWPWRRLQLHHARR